MSPYYFWFRYWNEKNQNRRMFKTKNKHEKRSLVGFSLEYIFRKNLVVEKAKKQIRQETTRSKDLKVRFVVCCHYHSLTVSR